MKCLFLCYRLRFFCGCKRAEHTTTGTTWLCLERVERKQTFIHGSGDLATGRNRTPRCVNRWLGKFIYPHMGLSPYSPMRPSIHLFLTKVDHFHPFISSFTSPFLFHLSTYPSIHPIAYLPVYFSFTPSAMYPALHHLLIYHPSIYPSSG